MLITHEFAWSSDCSLVTMRAVVGLEVISCDQDFKSLTLTGKSCGPLEEMEATLVAGVM